MLKRLPIMMMMIIKEVRAMIKMIMMKVSEVEMMVRITLLLVIYVLIILIGDLRESGFFDSSNYKEVKITLRICLYKNRLGFLCVIFYFILFFTRKILRLCPYA